MKQNVYGLDWFGPDSTMHKERCYTDKVKVGIESINNQVAKMCEGLDDTIVIITADHGQINISDEIFLNEIPEIDEYLIMQPSSETRAASLFIKPEMINVFKQRFYKYFENDFQLIPKVEIMKSGILGNGQHAGLTEEEMIVPLIVIEKPYHNIFCKRC